MLSAVTASVRWRHVGPRALIEDAAVRAKATSLVSLEGGYRVSRALRLAVDVFNLLDAQDSDVDYFYTSRLPGEPLDGIAGIHCTRRCRARRASAWWSASDRRLVPGARYAASAAEGS